MNIKKIFLPIITVCLLTLIFIPFFVKADIVNCQGLSDCTIDKLLAMPIQVYDVILTIVTPLATLGVIIGAILIMTSAGNPNLMSKGKTIFWAAVIGLTLALGSKVIINFILQTFGNGTLKV